MVKNLKFVSFASMIKHGQMNSNKAFYPEGMSAQERNSIMKLNKKNFALEFGLDSKGIFIPIQKNNNSMDKYPNGQVITIDKSIVESYEDLYDYDAYGDIAKISVDTPNIAIAYPTADCAVISAVNLRTGEAVMSHCGGEYIDRYLPMQTIDALGGCEKDIIVHVSPFAHDLFYADATNLKWATNQDVWKGCITEKNENGQVSALVDIYTALRRQLLERKISCENLVFSDYDTATSPYFYSNSRGHQDDRFKGRFLAGVAIVEDNENLRNADERIIKVMR